MIYLNSFYFIGDEGGYCFNHSKDYIVSSNDWSYLIGSRRCSFPGSKEHYMDEDVVCFITSFSKGLHSFVGILSIINSYIRSNTSNKTIIINEDLQAGALDLIKELINPKKVIALEKNKLYKFKSIELIPNSLHSYFEDESLRDRIVETINNKIPCKSESSISRLAILKHVNSSVASTMGALSLEDVERFCHANSYTRIEPSELGEIDTIHTLRRARSVVFSWGTTFMKNFVYVSDACEKIDVFIFGREFSREYHNAIQRKILPFKYRNAIIKYHLDPNIENYDHYIT